MVARGGQRAFVCIECRLKSVRSSPNSFLRTNPHHRLFSVRRPAYSSSDASVQFLEQPLNHSAAGLRRIDGHAKPKLSRNRKFRGRDGKEFSENSVSLAAHALGKPAEVIVIRDAEPIGPQQTENELDLLPRDDNSEENERISGEILASLADGQVEESQEAVNSQIDKLRPVKAFPDQTPLSIPQSEYARAEKLLKDGFTISQLHKYARARSDLIKPRGGEEQPRGWSGWQRASGPMAIKYLKMRSLLVVPKVKTKLIRLILESLWNLEVVGEGEHTGQIHGIVKTGALQLLTFGRPSRIDTIGEQRKVKFDIDVKNHAVRIIGKKANVLRAARDINELRDSSVATTFNLQANLPKGTNIRSLLNSIRDEDLHAISELTSTVMTKFKESGIGILAISTDAIKDAQRAIMAIVHQPAGERQLRTETKRNVGPLVFHQTPTGENLPLSLQRLPFGRWSSVVSRSVPTAEENQSRMHPKEEEMLEPSRQLLEALKPICAIPQSVPTSSLDPENTGIRWKQDMDVEVSASLGHVLHRANSEAKVAVASKRLPKRLPDDWVFLKRVPNLCRVIPHFSLNQDTPAHEILSFKLLPSSANSGIPGQVKLFHRLELFPEIYVEVLVKNDLESGRSVQVHQVYAKVQEKLLDAMLPTLAADIRFLRTVIARADIESIDWNNSMKEFVQQAKAQCMGYGNLQNPSPVKITIPNHLLKWSRGKKKEKGIPTNDHIDVDYIFSSMESRYTIPFIFGEHHVSYNGVDAGKIGGSWQELLLHMPKLSEAGHETADINTQEDFAKATFALASKVDLIAKGSLQPPLIKRQLAAPTSQSTRAK